MSGELFVGKKLVKREGGETAGIQFDTVLVDRLFEIGGTRLAGFYAALEAKNFGEVQGKDFVPEFCKKCKISRREFDRYIDLLVSHGIVERVPAGEEGGAADA